MVDRNHLHYFVMGNPYIHHKRNKFTNFIEMAFILLLLHGQFRAA